MVQLHPLLINHLKVVSIRHFFSMFTKSYNTFIDKNSIHASVIQEDLEQIDCDDLEDMDIKWQASMLALRTKRFYNKTGRPCFAGPNDRIGFDKSKAVCYSYQQPGAFARECNLPIQLNKCVLN